MSPYRTVRIVVEPGPKWWRATTTKFWVYALATVYHVALCVFVVAYAAPLSLGILLVSLVFAAMNAFECLAEWVEAIRPRLAPRTRVVPGPPPPLPPCP